MTNADGGHAHSDKGIYDWWEDRQETQQLLPGHGYECRVIFRRGVVWIWQRCPPPASSRDPGLDAVVSARLEQLGARCLTQEDERHRLNPMEWLPELGKDKYLAEWAKAEAAVDTNPQDTTPT